MTRSMILRLGGTVVFAMAAATAAAAPPADPFSDCRARFARQPDDYESSYCFYQVTVDRSLWDDGIGLFDALIKKNPDNFWLPLAYGHVYRSRDPARAESLYRQSASGFRQRNNAEGELLARSNLRDFLFPRGRVIDATIEVKRVLEIADSVDDPLLKARAWTLHATHLQDTGGDLGLAHRLLKQTESAIFPDGPYRLRRTTLTSLGNVAFRMGRLDEALALFERLDELAATEGEARVQANARYNILNTWSLKESLLPSPGGKQRLMALAERALATALAAQSLEITVKTHRAIAELLANDRDSQSAAIEHARKCVALAVTIRVPHDVAVCSWVEASLLRDKNPQQSRTAELRALEATARANSPRTQAFSSGRRMRLSWDTRPRAQAIKDSLASIDAIETLRNLQDDAESSAELFSAWTLDYYWLAGRLLQDPQDQDLELAFSITERMRARSLLDAVARSRAPQDKAHPLVQSRRGLLEAIAAVQRGLMDPTIDQSERRRALEKLEGLELREQEAQRQLAVSFPNGSRERPAFASLGTVQSTLAENEAMLSFQVGLWETSEGEFGGGSWLLAVTRHTRAIYRLPDRARLTPMVPVFNGLLAREDGLETAAAVRLYAELLSDALLELPSGIRRLVIIPDGVLHHLPFDALRAHPDAKPLGASYEVIVAPSATLWRHWRATAPTRATGRALALADPALQVSIDVNASERNATLQQGLRLGRLPHARQESRALERHFGGVDALFGERASERALKDRDLRGYDILHLAAHAIADEAHPERSAVLLSPGAASEDGLLQAREITGLDLDGRIVVLSACRTVSGAVLSGEGVLSLARAFFEAGAHTVIGSRWPIRDQDAAAFFEIVYRLLGEGASLSEAMTRAKIQTIAAGRPAATWASLVLLGDGDFRPFPHGRPPTTPALWIPAVAVVISLLFTLGVVRTARRSRPS